MKRRVRKIANFFAFNLLFFALYLNFVHKDNAAAAPTEQTIHQNTAAFSGTIPVDNPEVYLEKKVEPTSNVAVQKPAKKSAESDGALKLSIN